MALLTQMFNNLGMNKKEDVSKDLRPYKIKNDNECLNKILSMTDETLNPFDVNIDKSHFFNIATRKSAKKETPAFLLSIYQTSFEMRQKFPEECRKEPKHFKEQINCHKLFMFQTECGGKRYQTRMAKFLQHVL